MCRVVCLHVGWLVHASSRGWTMRLLERPACWSFIGRARMLLPKFTYSWETAFIERKYMYNDGKIFKWSVTRAFYHTTSWCFNSTLHPHLIAPTWCYFPYHATPTPYRSHTVQFPHCTQGIINMNRNGNFCKGTWVSEVIAETKVDACVERWKKFTGFSRMSVMADLLCFGCFAAG